MLVDMDTHMVLVDTRINFFSEKVEKEKSPADNSAGLFLILDEKELYEACEISGVISLPRIARRSSSDRPPQIPYGS
jgi:hypothetical protein